MSHGRDNPDYEMLENAVRSIRGVKGLTVEIGLRRGDGSKIIVDACLANNDKRTHIAIDPYGNIPYDVDGKLTNYDYTNQMKNEALPQIFKAFDRINFLYFCLEDFEFFKRFSDGVPVYEDGIKTLVNEYALVYLDGPHSVEAVSAEVEFFSTRTPIGGVWIFDDLNVYDHSVVEPKIFSYGFELIAKAGPKTHVMGSYKRRTL